LLLYLSQETNAKDFFSFLGRKDQCEINFYIVTNLTFEEQLDLTLNMAVFTETLRYRFLTNVEWLQDYP